MPAELQYVYYAAGVVSIIFTIITTQQHAEKKFEKRMVRIETFLMLCCRELKIPTHDINEK